MPLDSRAIDLIVSYGTANPDVSASAIYKAMREAGFSYRKQNTLNDIRAILKRDYTGGIRGEAASRLGGRVSGLVRTTESKEYVNRTEARAAARKAALSRDWVKRDDRRDAERDSDRKLLQLRAMKERGITAREASKLDSAGALQLIYPEEFGQPNWEPDDVEYSE